jgi:sucrose phosphorylase
MPTIKPSHFHFNEPHFRRENFEIPKDVKLGLFEKLKRLYGKTLAEKYYSELERIIKVYYAYKSPEMIQWEKSFRPENRFSED